jgi:hypothetical protein
MAVTMNLFMYRSTKTKGLFCFSGDSHGVGLPDSLAPWTAYGVLRRDQIPPHGLSRTAIEEGITARGYQLWREKPKSAAPQPAAAREE